MPPFTLVQSLVSISTVVDLVISSSYLFLTLDTGRDQYTYNGSQFELKDQSSDT